MDIIFIENFAVSGKHGVYLKERQIEQEFIISLEMYVDVSKARVSDDVEDTVDYSNVKKVVSETVKGNSFYLLERLGQVIGEALLQQFSQVSTVSVTIKKSAVWKDAIPGVTIFSQR